MENVRLFRLALILTAALTLAGCGAKDKAASGGAAKIVPASAPAYVTVDSNADSSQWGQIEKLLEKFPDGGEAIRFLRSSFEDDTKLDWERDVKPALGDEIDLVWLDFEGGGGNVVAVTKPKDREKFKTAVTKANASDESDDELLVGEHEDWLVLSDAQAKIDRFKQQVPKGDSLADDSTYKDAVAELPSDALLTVFARGENLTSAFQKALGGITGGSPFQLTPGERPEFVTAALAAEDGGLHFVGRTRTEQEANDQIQTYESKLLDDVPGDALAFATFRGGDALDKQLRQLQGDAGGEALKEFERMLGVQLEDVTGLFENEVALYVRGGTPLPEFTLLLEAQDEVAAKKTIDGVLAKVSSTLPAEPCHEPPEQAGVKTSCVEIGDFEVRTAAFDGKAVVTTGPKAIEEIRSGGPRLADDDAFKDARGSAGVPDKNGGLVWLDLEDGLPLVFGFADLSGEEIPPQLRRNLEPLRSLVAWAERDGRTSSAELFLAID